MSCLHLERYLLANTNQIDSPALIFYEDMIRDNLQEMLRIAGGPARLWPHVKSHKMKALVRIQQELGVCRFKCATIAEAEILAQCNVEDVLLAYPLVGPTITRFLQLRDAYPKTRFWAIGDNLRQLRQLGASAGKQPVLFLIDVDMGQHRTGVPLRGLEQFAQSCVAITGLLLKGFHCYDGGDNSSDPKQRQSDVACSIGQLNSIRTSLRAKGIAWEVAVMGGTPTFPCHAKLHVDALSPGTSVLYDYGYLSRYPDLPFSPAAALLTRVISKGEDGLFTTDLGYKAIASDPSGIRGVIVGMDAVPVFQNEEHWVFRLGLASQPMPKIGDVLYVVPTHICPTTALYPAALVSRDHYIADRWEVSARNRKLII